MLRKIISVTIWCILFAISTVFLGCKKLDQEPEATATKDAVFSSQSGLDLYTYSLYNILPDASTLVRADNMADYSARTAAPDFIRQGAYSAQQSSGWSWTALRNINYFLENNNNTSITKTVRDNYNGIARFFRAWFYFEKVKRFGDVPWIGKTMTVDDPTLYAKRDSRTLVMDSIIADLDYACNNITTTDNTRSLITKHVAYAFKSRVCLFEGTFRKYHTNYNLQSTANDLLQKAADAAQKVMTDGGFSLYTANGSDKSYRQLFTSNSPVTSEIILANVMDATLAVYNDANWYWTSSTYGDRTSLTRTFVNTYLKTDGTPFTNSTGYQTMPFVQEVKSRDMRLQQTIRMGSYTRISSGSTIAAPPSFSYTYTGYQPIKLTLDDAAMDGSAINTNSLPMIRYAEVLLNYAEAKAELGTLTNADWNTTIGALRRRAGINGTTTTIKPTVIDTYLQTNYFPSITDPVILEVRRERGIELVFEGFRFYDLVRWKRGELMEQTWNGFYVPAVDQNMDLNEDGKPDVYFYTNTKPSTTVSGVTYVSVASTGSLKLSNGTSGELTWLTNVTRKWEDKNYLYPIPEADRLVNPALGQNPGW